jgi:cohesin domain-containing protein
MKEAENTKAASGPGASVSLGSVSGTAKNEVAVPLMLAPHPSDTRIGGVEMTVAYESPYVAYQRAEKGFLLDGVGGVIDAREVKDPDNAKKSRVMLKVETKGDSGNTLPDGLILTLIFEVKANAVPKIVVPLKIEKLTVTETGAAARVLHGSVDKNGSIEVILPEEVPVMPCFFFSH